MKVFYIFLLISIVAHGVVIFTVKPMAYNKLTPISNNVISVDVVQKSNKGNKNPNKTNNEFEQQEIKQPLNKDLKKETAKNEKQEDDNNKNIMEGLTEKPKKEKINKKNNDNNKNKKVSKNKNDLKEDTKNKESNNDLYNNKKENEETIYQEEVKSNQGDSLTEDTGKSVTGKATYMPKPKYPLTSRRNKEEGTVLFKIDIDEKGKLISYEIIKSSGFERLDTAAIDSVKKAKYQPTIKNNKAISSTIEISFNFNLKEYNLQNK